MTNTNNIDLEILYKTFISRFPEITYIELKLKHETVPHVIIYTPKDFFKTKGISEFICMELNKIKLKSNAIQITQYFPLKLDKPNWDRTFIRANGLFFDFQEEFTPYITASLIFVLIGLILIGINNTNSSSTHFNAKPRVFLGKSESGYELWKDDSCVYAKGVKESDLRRLNVTLDGMKQAIKTQTNSDCVIFE